jgi:hypothetical protein
VCGLLDGDVLIKIGDVPANGLRHKEAQDLIVETTDFLELSVNRYVLYLFDNLYEPFDLTRPSFCISNNTVVDKSSTCGLRLRHVCGTMATKNTM